MRNQLCAAFAAFTVLTAGAAAQLTPLVDYYQRFDRGITLGTNAWTNSIGTLRRDPAGFRPQVSDGTNWHAVGDLSDAPFDSVTYGRKDGFWVAVPTNDPAALSAAAGVESNLTAHVSDTNNPHAVTADQLGAPTWADLSAGNYVSVANPTNGAFLVLDGTNWVSTYSVRASVDYAAWLSSVGVSAPATTNSFPGTLVSYAGSTYMLKKNLDHAEYFATYGNIAPGLHDSTWWLSFAAKGDRGSTGQPGDDGLDGVGQVLYGEWDGTKEYVYDTNAIPLVSYGGQLFAARASSTGQIPAIATSYWSVAVAKGVDAELVGAANLVYRGTWAALGNYVSNDVVYWYGNMFVVTTNDPPAGVAPGIGADRVGTNSFYWDVLVAKGERGVPGAQGADGAVTYITNLFYLYGSDVAFYRATNEPAGRDDILYYSESSGTNELLRWGPSPTAALTNLLSTSYRRVWPAEVSGTAVTLRPESNFMWRLDTAADAVFTWNLAVPGRATNEVAILGLETFRAESNSWTWMSGLTNAPPAVGETNLFLLFLPEGSTNWMLY